MQVKVVSRSRPIWLSVQDTDTGRRHVLLVPVQGEIPKERDIIKVTGDAGGVLFMNPILQS